MKAFHRCRWSAATIFLAALAVTAVATAAPAARLGTVTVVASGLDNPRGLTFLSDGSLLVAEAGHGGDVCVADSAAPSGKHCIGTT